MQNQKALKILRITLAQLFIKAKERAKAKVTDMEIKTISKISLRLSPTSYYPPFFFFPKVKAKERHPQHRNHRTPRMNHRRLKCPNIAHWMCSLAVVDCPKASTKLVRHKY